MQIFIAVSGEAMWQQSCHRKVSGGENIGDRGPLNAVVTPARDWTCEL